MRRAVAPFDEGLGGQDGVEAVAETYHTARDEALRVVAAHADGEGEAGGQVLTELGEGLGGCETEVVEGQVTAGQDDGDGSLAGRIVPVLVADIDKFIGYGLEEEFRTHGLAAQGHLGPYAVLAGGEGPYLAGEGLGGDVVNFLLREGSVVTREAIEGFYLLAHHEVVALHESVLL